MNLRAPDCIRALAFSLAAAIPLLLAGCGGGDDFDRAPVSGTVTLDGSPLPYGTILFEGEPNAQNQSAKSTLRIVDGKFESSAGYGPAPGENKIRITVFNEPAPTNPDDETETTIKGTLDSTVEVAAEQPLKLEIKSEDLER